MLADLRWLGLNWDEGPDKEGQVCRCAHTAVDTVLRVMTPRLLGLCFCLLHLSLILVLHELLRSASTVETSVYFKDVFLNGGTLQCEKMTGAGCR